MSPSISHRDRIVTAIRNKPGIHLRQLHRELGISLGQVQYHLDRILSTTDIISARHGGFRRYFPRSITARADRNVLACLHSRIQRHILLQLAIHGGRTHTDLLPSVSIAPSTLSYHLNQLKKMDVIIASGRDYRISDLAHFRRVLWQWGGRFGDPLITIHFSHQPPGPTDAPITSLRQILVIQDPASPALPPLEEAHPGQLLQSTAAGGDVRGVLNLVALLQEPSGVVIDTRSNDIRQPPPSSEMCLLLGHLLQRGFQVRVLVDDPGHVGWLSRLGLQVLAMGPGELQQMLAGSRPPTLPPQMLDPPRRSGQSLWVPGSTEFVQRTLGHLGDRIRLAAVEGDITDVRGPGYFALVGRRRDRAPEGGFVADVALGWALDQPDLVPILEETVPVPLGVRGKIRWLLPGTLKHALEELVRPAG